MAPDKTIALTYGTHGAIAVVWVKCRDDAALIQQLKNQAGARWSQTQKCWYIPKEAFSLHEFFEAFRKFGFIDYSGVKKSSSKRPENRQNKSKPATKRKRNYLMYIEIHPELCRPAPGGSHYAHSPAASFNLFYQSFPSRILS